MKHNRKLALLGSFIGIFLLIIDGQTALQGASEGIELCIRTVIPSLFPFFVLSTVLTSTLLGTSIGLLRPLFHLMGVPPGAESLVLTGFLGGYPVGAQSISGAYRRGVLSKSTAQRMLAFCNNAGPAFIFGMIGSVFPNQWMIWGLWSIHLFGAIFAALIIPNANENNLTVVNGKTMNLTDAVTASIRVLATVCAWIILFRVVIAFLERWFLFRLPIALQVSLAGVLELTNGCCALAQIENVNLRFVICSGMLAFGGICVLMQTTSVTSGLSLKQYFYGKMIQSLFSLLAASILCIARRSHYYFLSIPIIFSAILVLRVWKKRCIPAESIV